MKKKIINIVLLAATVAMTGCNDWLDMSPTNKVSEKIVCDSVCQWVLSLHLPVRGV